MRTHVGSQPVRTAVETNVGFFIRTCHSAVMDGDALHVSVRRQSRADGKRLYLYQLLRRASGLRTHFIKSICLFHLEAKPHGALSPLSVCIRGEPFVCANPLSLIEVKHSAFRFPDIITGGELLCKFKRPLLEKMGRRFAQSPALQWPVLTPAFVLFLWVWFEWRLGPTAAVLYDLQTLPLLFCCCSLYAFLSLPPPSQSSPAAACRGLLREIMMSASLWSLCFMPALPGWQSFFAQIATLSAVFLKSRCLSRESESEREQLSFCCIGITL